MAFCGRGWSERALDPDPHDLLIRGWAALVRPIATTTRQDALRIFAFAARFQDTELQPRRARCFPDSFDVALSIDARKADQRRPGSDRRHRRAITGIIEPCRPWLSWVGLHCLWGMDGRLSGRVLPTSPICAGAACACWSGGIVDVSETGFCSPATAAVQPVRLAPARDSPGRRSGSADRNKRMHTSA
jgi:hypothetical protein